MIKVLFLSLSLKFAHKSSLRLDLVPENGDTRRIYINECEEYENENESGMTIGDDNWGEQKIAESGMTNQNRRRMANECG